MKKLFLIGILLCVILCICLACLCILNNKSSTIIEIYYGSPYGVIMLNTPIEDKVSTSNSYYLRIKKSSLFSKPSVEQFRFNNGKEELYSTRVNKNEFFALYAANPDIIFGPFVSVYDVYCFDDTVATACDAAIYYVTENGDYVLCKQSMYSDWNKTGDIYLFTVEEYREFFNAIRDYNRSQSAELDEYGRATFADWSDVYDVSSLKLKTRYTKIIAVAVAVPLSVAAVAIIVGRRRRRRATL